MSVTYNDYKIMANNISYWLIKNNKKIKTRKEYSLKSNGKITKKTLSEIKTIILKSKNTANGWGRKFLEAAVIDNTNTSLFPNYVAYKGKEYKKAEYVYMAKYVNAWWSNKEHTKAPTSVPTSKSSKTLNPYMTNQGCSGMGQCTGYYCACNSLQQAFYRLTGIKVSESTIAGWAGTTSSGTDHEGINTAVAKFNLKYKKKVKIDWKNFSDLGANDAARWKALQNYIAKGAVFCHLLYRDKWGHYEVPYNVSSDPCKILNSLGDSCGSGTYCGYVESRSRSTQKRYIQGISQKSIAILTI